MASFTANNLVLSKGGSEERQHFSPSGTVARASHRFVACRYQQLKLISVVYKVSIKCSTKIGNDIFVSINVHVRPIMCLLSFKHHHHY